VSTFPNLAGAKYMSLATFRKNGDEVRTPVWFAESAKGVVFFTNPKLGKVKRLRRESRCRVAPCTARGAVTGEWRDGLGRFLDGDEAQAARRAIKTKYWLARLPVWFRSTVHVEIVPA
jgi:PPOX class probable F420-dependent enzyme